MNHSGNRGGKRLLGMGILATALLALPAALVRADDTEIYFNEAPPDAPPPLVMLTLDWRSNLTSDVPACNTVDSDECRAYFGTDEVGRLIHSQLDKTSNVKKFDTFRAVFKAIFASDVADGMRIGFMMNHNDCRSGAACGDQSNGGYVLRGFELFEVDDPNGAKEELLEIMKAIPLPIGVEAHPYQGRELFFELYRYLAGLEVMNGKRGYADFGSSPTGTIRRNLDHEFARGRSSAAGDECAFTVDVTKSGDNRSCTGYLTGDYLASEHSNLANGGIRISSALTWDPDIITTSGSTDRYISPYKVGEDWSCSGAYSINLLFAVSQQEDNSDDAIKKPLAEQGLALPSGGPDTGFPPIIAKLNQMDHAAGQAPGVPNVAGLQNLTSYFLVEKVDTKTNGYAAAGGTGNAIAALDDPRALFEALTNVFSQIKAVSSSFVAVTVPVNADNRVTSLPNVFVALFQVDENGKPLWPGNVKKLDVVTTTLLDGSKQLDVEDALGNPAFNPITGRLDDNALTLWTVPTAADVVAADASKLEVSGRDGSSVRRGGAGHKIPGYISPGVGEKNDPGARQIFLEPATVDGTLAAGNTLVPLDASDTSPLLTDSTKLADIQTRFGFRGTDTAPPCGSDGTYCLSVIDEVLDAADAQPTGSPSNDEKAQVATQVLLRWIRGFDVFNEAGASPQPNGRTTTAQRKWLMGDVLHSRPVAINYGARGSYSEKNQDVRLVFGANDGVLRMVRNTEPGAAIPSAVTQQGPTYGQEVWAFMPREVLNHVPRLAMTAGNVGVNRPYGVDGEPTLFTIDTNRDGIVDNGGGCTVGEVDCDRAWVYFGLRRGGKSYYAIDVSNPDASAPKLLWKIDDSMAEFTELGLTFSTPRVGWVRFENDPANEFDDPDDVPDLGVTNVPVPVVIVGGGYHGHALEAGDHHISGADSKDKLSYYGADTGEGNAVFIVHARTGELIWKVADGAATATATESFHPDMDHGFAAAVAPMDADGDNILDRLYVPDTGGRMWRIDIPQYVPGISPDNHRAANWKASVLADLRPSDAELATSTDNDLRFFHAATIVRRARDGIGVYDAIAVGSGDREHPQSETNKNNWFFLFKDRLTTSGDGAVASRTPYTPADLLDVTDACFTGSSTPACDDSDPTSDLSKGWRLALEEIGEKNLSSPFIGGNGIIFTTYLPEGSGPDDDPCSPLGTSRLYQVGLDKGEPLRFLHDVVGDTFSKTDRWINLYSGIDGGVVAVSPDFWITASGKSGKNPPQKPIQFYWRESGVDEVK